MRRRRLISAAAFVALVATPALWAARGEGPTIRGRLAEPVPAGAGPTVVELYPLLDPHALALAELSGSAAPATVARVEAAVDGSFELAAPGPGPWLVRVAIPGRLPHVRVVPPVFDVVELDPVPLVRAEDVTVTVVGAAGDPLRGARLATRGKVSFGWLIAPHPIGATRADGRAVAHRPLEHGWGLMLAAWAPGLAESETVRPRDAAATVAVPAAEPRLLELRDAGDLPLARAVIRFDPGPGKHRPAPWPAGVTDDLGRVVAALPAGAEAVRVETGRGWAVSLPLPEGCGTTETPCRLHLPAPIELTGEVRDAVSSRPIGGALVWSFHQPDRVATTDGRGRFVLRFAPDAPPERLLAEADGYAGREEWRRADAPTGPLLVALEPAQRIAGRVVDSEGVPLEGARIRLLPSASSEPWTTEPSWREEVTRSAAGGRFRLPDVPAESGHRLRAELTGYAPAEVHAPPGAADDLEIVLTPGGGVFGRLVDGAGAPATGGSVRLLHVPDSQSRSYSYRNGELVVDAASTADGQGRFVLHNVAPGRYEALAGHPDHAPRKLPPFEVSEGGTTDLGTVELAPGGRLAGRVVAPEGRPVEGADLEADLVSRADTFASGVLKVRGRSDAEGRFELNGLPAEEPLRLTVRHSDYPVADLEGLVVPRDEPLVVELRRGARVFGRVVGPAGEPIEDAAVQARVEIPLHGGFRSAGTGHDETGADGGFEIEGLGAGVLRLSARADGYPEREVAGTTIGDDGDVGPVEIRLDAGAEVSGRVLAPDGSPAPGVSVGIYTGRTPAELGIGRSSLLARPEEPVTPSWAGAVSGARGEFVVRGVALGPATAKAEHDRLGDAAAELVVRAGANTIELILDPRGRIHGRVVDPDGDPVPRARVELIAAGGVYPSEPFANTDAGGRFLFRWLSRGEYSLVARASGLRLEGPPVTVSVADAPAPPVELVLTPGEEIVGRVLGVPEAELAEVRVSASRPRDESGRDSRSSASSGADGRFRLAGLDAGRWTVRAGTRTGRSASGEVEVTAGGGPYRLDLDLGGGLTLTGSVRLDGEPLAGASVMISGIVAGVPRGAGVETALDGTFRAEGLEPGDYQLVVGGASGSMLARRELTLTGDDEIHLDLTAASLSGRVVDHGGEPVENANVVVTVDGGPDLRVAGLVSTDGAGRFAFRELAPDRYEVTAAVEGKPVPRATVSLAAGEHRELELRLESGLELVLVPGLAGGGQPHLLDLLVLRGPGMPVYGGRAPVGADGTAVFSDVPAGAWTITVHAPETAMIEAAVEVPGPPVTLVLPPPTVLEIEAPALDEGVMVPLVIVGPDGRPPAIVAQGMEPRLFQGRARIPRLPPGTWTVRAVAPDGRELQGTATTTPGPPARLVLNTAAEN